MDLYLICRELAIDSCSICSPFELKYFDRMDSLCSVLELKVKGILFALQVFVQSVGRKTKYQHKMKSSGITKVFTRRASFFFVLFS